MSLAQGNNTPTRPRIEPGSPDPESNNAAINIAYGNNSKRVKIKISGGSDITFLFPTALAETLGIDPNYFKIISTTTEHVFATA